MKKYQTYNFIAVKQTADDWDTLTRKIKHNPQLNNIFNRDKNTWNYDAFYKAMGNDADVFYIPELDLKVIPSSNYLFEYIGD